MAIRKKVVKKSLKTSKHTKAKVVKFKRKPAQKVVKKAAKPSKPKQIIKKRVVKSKKPAAKTISHSTKKPVAKVISKMVVPFKKILTAEGWRRMMLKKHKA